MINQQKEFSNMVMTLMNLCLDAVDYYQCTSALIEDPELKQNRAKNCIFESLLTKLILTISLIGYKEKASYNIFELIEFSIKNKNIFKEDNKIVVVNSKRFQEELESINSKLEMILNFRHKLLAHFSKKEVEKNINSPIHPFYGMIDEIFKISGMKDIEDFLNVTETIINLFSKILNYFNSISKEELQMQYSININDKEVYEQMRTLIK